MNAVIKVLRKALDADPSDWENRHALIEAYLKEDLPNEARMLLNEIEELPEDEASLIAAAQCYAIAGATADGREILQPVLAANPSNPEAHLALASIAHIEGDTKTAMRHYITATSLDPGISAPKLEAAYGHILSPAAPEEKEVTPAPEPESEVIAVEEIAQAVEPASEEEEAAVEAVAEIEPELESEPAVESVEEVEVIETAEPEVHELELAEPEAESVAEESHAEPAAEAVVEAEPSENTSKTPLFKHSEKLAPPPPLKAKPKKHHRVHDADADPGAEGGSDVEETIKSQLSGGEEEFEEMDAEEEELEALSHELKNRHDEIEGKRKRQMRRDKMASLTLTLLLHVGVIALLAIVVISVPRDVPPQLIASVSQDTPDSEIKQVNVQRTAVKPASSAASVPDIISSASVSNLAMTSTSFEGVGTAPSYGVEFAPSMAFGDASASMKSKMMFGQKMEGEVLGVILDVSGSMAEYLPIVIREVDKNFKNAPIVYVNHAGILGASKGTEIYPIIESEVLPSWPREWAKGNSPFWFLWGDLPRKAPQHAVDRLIGIFKQRLNMFIARGGNNRVGAAVDFLVQEKCDSLYIFSDFEDFVDEEVCVAMGQKLGLKKVRAYVQPAAATTEHFAVMAKKVANRSKGRSMPPLTDILRPQDQTPPPIMVEVEKETPIPDGVNFATVREEREGANVWYFNWRWGDDNQKERFKDVIEVVEYPNFDIVIRGPEARAYIYMKNGKGYIQNPIIFGYYSTKPYLDERDERWHTRRRKFLRNIEPPTLDDDTFTWRMMLEDEIEFKVLFWFKEDSMTATYMAEIPENGEADGAYIYFVVPPMARESKDTYYSVDFPDGLSLDDLRLAMTNNTANFYLPAQAEDALGTSWSRLGFGRGANISPYNVIYRDLPTGVREVTIGGPSFGPRKLEARTTSNNLLLRTGNRADMELWEGFAAYLVRPRDIRERISKLEAIKFSVE